MLTYFRLLFNLSVQKSSLDDWSMTLQARCPYFQQANSVKAMNGTIWRDSVYRAVIIASPLQEFTDYKFWLL